MVTRKTSANVSTTLEEHHVEERGSPSERLSMFKTCIWDQRSPLIIDTHRRLLLITRVHSTLLSWRVTSDLGQ